MRRFLAVLLALMACSAVLLLITGGDWLRASLGALRGHIVIGVELAFLTTLSLTARSLYSRNLAGAALAGAAALAIACGTMAWLFHPETQFAIASSRVTDVESQIGYAQTVAPLGDEAERS